MPYKQGTAVPGYGYNVPTLNHTKNRTYKDFPIVSNATLTNEPFYIENDCTITTSDLANTTLKKWEGNGWVTVTGLVSPDVIVGRGFFAVTTAANAYVTLTEHKDSD